MFLPARSARPNVPLVSLFIVENIPMLHAMASSAAHHLKAERPQAVIPTTLALYTAATLLTAMAFLLCGGLIWLDERWRNSGNWGDGDSDIGKKRTKRTFGKMGKVCRRLTKLPKQLAFEWWLRGKRWLKVGGLKKRRNWGWAKQEKLRFTPKLLPLCVAPCSQKCRVGRLRTNEERPSGFKQTKIWISAGTHYN